MKRFFTLLIAVFLLYPALLRGFTIGPVTTLSDQGSNSAPQVAVDGLGNTFFIWVKNFPNFPTQIEVVRFSSMFANFSVPIILSQWPTTSITNNFGGFPQIATNTAGNAAAIWVNGATAQIEAALFNVTTLTWSLPIQISVPPSTNVTPQIAIDSLGNAVAIWNQLLPTQSAIFAAFFNVSTGVWSLPVNLTNLGTVPQVAINADGSGFAVWQTFLTLSPSVIQTVRLQIP